MPSALERSKRRAQGWRLKGDGFKGADLSGLVAYGAEFAQCYFEACQLTMADVRQGQCIGTTFDDSSMIGAGFAVSQFEEVHFLGCNLQGAVFDGAVFRACIFHECNLEFSSFKGATLRNVEFRQCRMRGADLDFMEIGTQGASFIGCDLWSAKVALGCQFFNATFDERTIRMFVALAARKTKDESLLAFCGEEYDLVKRLVEGSDDGG